MPLQATSGAASYDAFGGGVAAVPTYIEDVFSTWLYTGNGSTQTINNGIDLAGKGGLVWLKSRSSAQSNWLWDTARGSSNGIQSNSTASQASFSGVSGFNSNGFNLGADNATNDSGVTFASWTFREQPKFFDVVTWTGNGVAGRQIPHNLQSAPGFVVVKITSNTGNWNCIHRQSGSGWTALQLNSTAAGGSPSPSVWGDGSSFIAPTSTNLTVGSIAINTSGETYVAYLFAHNAGGFGLTGTDNVISCGSYTGNGSTTGPTVNLGYEPQWILLKNATTGTTEWVLLDNMRGMAVTGNSQYLRPNSSGAESGFENFLAPTATGFQVNSNDSWINSSGNTYIYIAIRRGPMKVPTTGTSVFDDIAATNTNGTQRTVGFPSDFVLAKARDQVSGFAIQDRLRGALTPNAAGTAVPTLVTSSAAAETSFAGSTGIVYDVNNTQATDGTYLGVNPSIFYHLRRAPSVFDEVCYTGTGTTGQTYAHNLGVAPELMIVKSRTVGSAWYVYTPTTGNTNTLVLNSTAAVAVRNVWGDTSPTASVFSVGTSGAGTNNASATYVAYLFASCPGVSKVGSYTGTGTTQVINCGFTAGSRFVMIKRTDSTGDWYVWDSARGIVAGNDPYLLFNSTAAEVTNTDFVDTAATGFEISSTAPAAINASGGTFIFLAIS